MMVLLPRRSIGNRKVPIEKADVVATLLEILETLSDRPRVGTKMMEETNATPAKGGSRLCGDV